jgi:hypothetical protein
MKSPQHGSGPSRRLQCSAESYIDGYELLFEPQATFSQFSDKRWRVIEN